jgi:hypothetical protein
MNELYKYKSSKFATYSQYVAIPIIVGIFLFQIYYFFVAGNIIDEESLFFMPFWLWASIVVIINFIKLRYIEVRENDILIKSFGAEKVLNYKDIVWINQNIFGSNWYILSIKYKDIETNKLRIIFILPEQYTRREEWKVINIFQELNITKYIREQIIKVNPSYNLSNEPSRWYLFLWMLLIFIPFIFLSFILII